MSLCTLLWYYNRFINTLEALGGSASLAKDVARNTTLWDTTLDAFVIGINQVSFSGWKTDECIAIGNEILSWKQKGLSESEGAVSSLISIYFICPCLNTFIVVKTQKYPDCFLSCVKVVKMGNIFGH